MPTVQDQQVLRHGVSALLRSSNTQYKCPPWLRFPATSKGHCFWRMGEGDYYRFQWEEWFVTLDTSQREVYKRAFPPPPSWNRPPYTYYDVIEEVDGAWEFACDAAVVAEELDRTLWTSDGLPPCTQSCNDVTTSIHFSNSCHTVDVTDVIDASCLSLRFGWRPAQPADTTTPVSTTLFHEGAGNFQDNFGSVAEYIVFRAQELRTQYLIQEEVANTELVQRFVPPPGDFSGLERLEEALTATLDPPSVWATQFFSIIAEANFLKFSQNPALRHYLLQCTGDAVLVCDQTGSPGAGAQLARDIWDDETRADNVFGKALMAARTAIRDVFAFEDVFEE